MDSNINNIKANLEEYFKDAVDFEFTIQDGKLWVDNARPQKRTGRANLQITTDLYFEKLINLNEAIARLRFQDIVEVLKPIISNEESLRIIGNGLPVSPGAATGRLYFSSQDIISNKGNSCILCRIEVSPEDLEAMYISNGVITSRGGMTSHAAVFTRGMGKPCISGIGNLDINYKERCAIINGYKIKEGDWITINSSNGKMFLGKGHLQIPDWRTNKYLYISSRLIEKAICTNKLENNIIGKSWLLRDFFLHNIPLEIGETEKKSVNTQKYTSFKQPSSEKIKLIYSSLNDLSSKTDDLILVIRGLRNSLLRQLANKVGIGNHYKYYRPLLDPMSFVKIKSLYNYEDLKVQLIGEDFFNIGKYIPNLIDIYKVKIFMEIQTDNENGLSFLDYTNPKGESIVFKDNNVVSLYIEINDQEIKLDDLPELYNTFRKREYFWTWYSENVTSHKEIVDFLHKPEVERIKKFRLNTYVHELELLENNSFTKSGKALIY